MTKSKTSVVIVNWNTCAELLDCLRSLEANPPEGPWEAIVIDNASTDGSPEAVQAVASWATLIVNRGNRGLAAGNNQGIQAATGETIVLCNPDVLFLPGSVDALNDLLDRRPRAAFAFARLLERDGSVQTCAGALPGFWEAFLGRNRQAILRRKPPNPSMWWDGWDPGVTSELEPMLKTWSRRD